MRRNRPRARALIAGGLCSALAAVVVAVGAPAGAAAPGPLVSCPGLLECGVIAVPLDHADPGSGRLGLVVSRLRPKAGIPSAGTLLFLTGGPGEAGIARDSAATMQRLRALSLNREVISIDLRGTGRSGALNCPGLQGSAPQGAAGIEGAVDACARRIGPARRHYDTGQVVGDLEAVRRSLGVERWAIGGVSYGTYVATRYARAHPARVDRLLLDSLVPPEGVSATGADGLAATRRIVGDALASDVQRLDAILARRAIPATVVRRDGTASRARVGGAGEPGVVVEALLTGDLSDASRAAFPAAVRAALSGDATLLARILGRGGGSVHHTRQSVAAQLASLCEDSPLPWRSATPVGERRRALEAAASATAAEVSPPFSARSVAAASPAAVCIAWPEAREPRDEGGALPAVPTLILGGGADVRTPVENAYRLAARSPRAEVVLVPGRGHSILGRDLRCADTAVRRFFAGRPAGRPCAGLPRGSAPRPLPPSSFAAFRRGLADQRPGRVALAALRATLGDVVPSIELGARKAGGTGLRGGTVVVSGIADLPFSSPVVVLDDFSYVLGVRVSGVVTLSSLLGRPTEGRLTVASPLGRADVRLGGGGVRLRLPGSPPLVARAPLTLAGSVPAG